MPEPHRNDGVLASSQKPTEPPASGQGEPNDRPCFQAPPHPYAAPLAAHAPFDLQRLLADSLALEEDLENQPAPVREALGRYRDQRSLLAQLVELGLLTAYQARRIQNGRTFGLLLGNYRVLNQIGVGGMGLVLKAEHIRMRRPRAIKVISFWDEPDAALVRRFRTEFRVLAEIQHPNMVQAVDAGEVAEPSRQGPVLHYFVMEYIPGYDLEELVNAAGPLEAGRACDLAYQVASALVETHQRNVVHGDIKPSNIRVTAEGHAKLLDFGLARDFRQRVTEHGAALGAIAYRAPEQVEQAEAVDIRADVYGLGATLYWCLTNQQPFPAQQGALQMPLRPHGSDQLSQCLDLPGRLPPQAGLAPVPLCPQAVSTRPRPASARAAAGVHLLESWSSYPNRSRTMPGVCSSWPGTLGSPLPSTQGRLP